MKISVAMGLLSVALAASVASAEMAPPSDAAFVMKASVGNTFEIEESQVALDKATDARLKDFAKKMIADHTDALKKLQDAAGKSGAKAEMMLDAPHQAMLDNLKTLAATDFDKIYIADQIASHSETMALLSDYKQNGKNGDLMSWTKNTLPAVMMHQAAINAM